MKWLFVEFRLIFLIGCFGVCALEYEAAQGIDCHAAIAAFIRSLLELQAITICDYSTSARSFSFGRLTSERNVSIQFQLNSRLIFGAFLLQITFLINLASQNTVRIV